jgi:xanthine dehydrogenase YagS FAD-binding subunit
MLHLAIDEPKSFQLLSPTTIAEALSIAADHDRDFSFLAGGCDLVDQLKHQLTMPRTVINLKEIAELRGIDKGPDRVRIGALTKLAEIERDHDLGLLLPALVQSAGRVATPQIRNMGTIGGNLLQDSRCPYYRGAWYCYRKGGIACDAHHGINTEHAIFGAARCYTVTPSDLAPTIVALDGTVHIRGSAGARTMRADQLFVSPDENILAMHRLRKDEILTAVELPVRATWRSAFIKYAQRNAWDFSRASVAATMNIENGRVRDCRVILGGVATVPWRSYDAERVIAGSPLSSEKIEAAAQAAVDRAEPLAHNGYKVGLVRKLVREVLTQLAG